MDLEGRLFARQGSHLVPCDLAAQDMVEGLKEGQQILIQHRRPRNPANHGHFFAVLNVAFQHMESYQNQDDLLDAVKIAVGHVRQIALANGDAAFLPKSINFASMPEDEFQRFKNRAFIVLERLSGIPIDDLITEAANRNKRVRR